MSKTTGGVIGAFTPDNLIAKNYPPVDAFIVELKVKGEYARGTVLCIESDGTYSVLGNKTEVFNGDGSTTQFTLTGTPTELTGVTVGGEPVTAYSYNSSTHKITFTTAPATGTGNIAVTYVSETLTGTPAAVIADDTAEEDTTASAYRSGHFYRNKLIVAEGYTMTAADEDALRRAGIFLSDGV